MVRWNDREKETEGKRDRKKNTDERDKEGEEQAMDTKDGTSHQEGGCNRVCKEREREGETQRKASKRSEVRRKKEEGEEKNCPNRLLIYTSTLAWKDDGRELPTLARRRDGVPRAGTTPVPNSSRLIILHYAKCVFYRMRNLVINGCPGDG